MCLLALLYRAVESAPLLVAANREEYFDRPFTPPQMQGERHRYLAGLDLRAGGTWLGVNDRGLVAAVTNRPKQNVPAAPRSRGLLCRELLECATAAEAAEYARRELLSNRYDGANFVVADADSGAIFEAGDTLAESPLTPGLHLVTNGAANNPHDPRHALAREMFDAADIHDVDSFLAAGRRVCGQGPDDRGRSILVRLSDRGTVSSSLIAVPTDRAAAAYYFSPGPPDKTPYEDYSAALRQLLQ